MFDAGMNSSQKLEPIIQGATRDIQYPHLFSATLPNAFLMKVDGTYFRGDIKP